ncbi:MAG TPA: aminoglycoside phosphotransferase family protein [Caulobacteraceae bacterium]|nr:aminoglycoside phosphotransferase family protein [Caulobacteraceae bacterium]
MTDYDAHLAALHAGFAAPDVLIAGAARAVSKSPIAARERIVHGEANEVYRIRFESGLSVILRIARHAPGLFEKEAWAIGRCRMLAMRVPEVLSIQRIESGGEILELCFLELLPGQRLSDSLALPRATLRSIVEEVGEQLSRMHTIGVADLGEAAQFFEGDTDDFLAMEGEFVRLGAAAGVNPAALERGFRAFETVMASGPVERRLTHNDIRACHILVHEGRLSGLIDFGQASMDSPINEFGKWAYWEEPELPVAWLEQGYGDKSLFGDGYRERLRLFRLVNGLWVLRWYALTGYPAGVERAAARIADDLAELDGPA